ncbi:FecR domain-containing protein [Reichenbachiella sp. MALMAid0571]|uniref:FecR family protein n=1 Tax=Reichenbachiella sp. MALMAid0571 TaxID=3143939 RepID=UPI0032DF8D9B
MKEENQHSISEELMFRYFSGDVTPEEVSAIKNWSALSSENQKLLDDTGIFYTDVEALSYLKKNKQAFDTDNAWEKVKFKNNIKGHDKRKTIKLPVSTLKYAAGLAILLMGIWFFIQKDNENIISVTAQDQVVEKLLSEGSKITLNKNSSISYPDKFNKNQRTVSLKGEAYFEVQSNPNQPFVISTQNTTIKVLGTSFNVSSEEASDSIVVTVDTGMVLFAANDQQEKLTPGSIGIYLKSKDLLYRKNTPKTITHDFWRTKTLTFSSVSLGEAIDAIEKTYNTNIQLSDTKLNSCKISVVFQDEELENVLDVIAATLHLEVENQSGQYILTGNGCD